MFERFSADARSAVARAQVIAQKTQAGLVEPAHLAPAVAGDTSGAGARVLTDLGVDLNNLETRSGAEHSIATIWAGSRSPTSTHSGRSASTRPN